MRGRLRGTHGAAGFLVCGAFAWGAASAAAAPYALNGWPRELGRHVTHASILALDLDRDGVPEVAVGADSALYLFRADGSAFIGNAPRVGGSLPGPIVGEIAASERFVLDPENPQPESWIAASVEAGAVVLWDSSGSSYSEGISSAPTTGPIFPGDPYDPEIVRFAVAGRSDGSVSYFPYEIVVTDGAWCGYEPIAAIATVNRTGIGGDEIVAVSAAGLVGVFPFHEHATMAPGWPRGGVATGGGFARTRLRWILSGDIDRTDASTPEIMVADSSGTIHLLNSVGRELPGWPVSLGHALASSPALGDVDGDGRLEIVAVDAGGEAHVLLSTGHEAYGWPRSFESAGAGGGYGTPPLVLDLADAPGRNVLAHLPSGLLKEPGAGAAWTVSDAAAVAGPIAVDLDGDGALEIAAVDAAGRISVIHTERPAGHDEGEWRMPGYDRERRASYPSGRLPPLQVPSELLPEASVACYPNPAPGVVLFVHYALDRPALVSLDLFDMAGERVASLGGTAFVGADNSVEIPLGGIASGVYALRIRAAEGTGTSTLWKKVAVLR